MHARRFFPRQSSVHDRRLIGLAQPVYLGGVLLVCSLVTTILTTQAVVELDKVDMATFAKAEGKLLSMQHAG